MSGARERNSLNVFANGRIVGRLARGDSGATAFDYDPDWLSWPMAGTPVPRGLRSFLSIMNEIRPHPLDPRQGLAGAVQG